MICIVDCGSQVTQNIARRIREQGVFSEIVRYDTKLGEILTPDLEGIVISGGQFSVHDEGAPKYDKALLEHGVPVLGICYGQQSIADFMGGEVRPTEQREYGQTPIVLEKESMLFSDIDEKEFDVWMSHGDIVERMPEGFAVLARSAAGHVAAMEKNGIYAVQFHPEVDHTEYGRKILDNFLNICNARRDWDPERDFDRIVEEMRETLEGKVGVGGISGGVDSTTASVLVKGIVGESYHPIFVDNGLLRLNESAEVIDIFSSLGLNVKYVDASALFLRNLKGVVDPDEKRKRIGHDFIAVFEEEARAIGHLDFLLQGTLYPDIIESVPVYGSSSKIKRHHNVGGLPEKMDLEVVEPFKRMFKDEVRRIAEHKLGIPKEIVWRHPFPGPGLAVRIVGSDVTPEKLAILREADAIYIDELKQRDLYCEIDQAFAALLPTQAIGVMGDAGTYEGIIALRAVTTNDFMTADWYDFNRRDIVEIVNKIINEVKGVNAVVYNLTQKPPGTIEYE